MLIESVSFLAVARNYPRGSQVAVEDMFKNIRHTCEEHFKMSHLGDDKKWLKKQTWRSLNSIVNEFKVDSAVVNESYFCQNDWCCMILVQ